MSIAALQLPSGLVAETIESNLLESSLVLGRTEEGVIFRGGDVAWAYTGAKAHSRVLLPRFTPDDADDRVEEISECFRKWDASVTWFVGPSARPSQLGEILSQNGYGRQQIWSGMALNLSDLPTAVPARIDGLRIERAVGPQAMSAWAGLGADQASAVEADGVVTLFSPENAGGDSRCRYYLGYCDGKPAVRGMAFVSGRTVGLYWIDMMPQYSDQGLDRAMVTYALREAVKNGAATAVALADDALRLTLLDLGFEGYCKFQTYSWPPAPIRMPLH